MWLKIWFWTEAKTLAVGAIATSPVLEIRASCDRANPEVFARSKIQILSHIGIDPN